MSRLCEGSWLETYLEYTRYQESPGKYHLWSGLVVLASALGRRVYRKRGFFQLFPNLYVGLIGPTGMRKSSAADIAGDRFYDTVEGVEWMRGKVTSWYLYKWMGDQSQAGKGCQVTILASELKALLGDINKVELVTLLTDLYGCPDKREFRTKKDGELFLTDVYINLLVCSTPEWLTLGITEEDTCGGFTGRFIYVCEDHTDRSFPFPEDFYDLHRLDERKEKLTMDLAHIGELEGEFSFTDEAKARYAVWYGSDRKTEFDERLGGYYSRKGDHVLKVAMLMSVSEGDSLVMTERHLEQAERVLKVAEKKMMMAFRGVVGDTSVRHREAILAWVEREGEIARSDLLRKFATKMDKDTLMRILDSLQAENRLMVVQDGLDSERRPKIIVRAT